MLAACQRSALVFARSTRVKFRFNPFLFFFFLHEQRIFNWEKAYRRRSSQLIISYDSDNVPTNLVDRRFDFNAGQLQEGCL